MSFSRNGISLRIFIGKIHPIIPQDDNSVRADFNFRIHLPEYRQFLIYLIAAHCSIGLDFEYSS